jgi:hypothetical protein
MANKDTQDRINALRQEEQLQRNLQTMLNQRITVSGKLTKAQEELSDSLLQANDLEEKLLTIQNKKDEILKKYNGNQKELGKKLLEQLETMEEYLKIEKKRKDKTEEIKELVEGTTDSLLESVGLSKEMFKNGVSFGLGMMVAKKAADMVSTAFESTVGLAKEMYLNMGTTAGEAARVGMETAKASVSMTGLLYGAEAVAESAKATAEYFGSTHVISSDMLKNVTELNAMMGDGAGAAQMSQILQSASGNASQLTDEIKSIAQDVGVDASFVFKEMGENANLLVGKSKEEIKVLARKTAELKKQGASMDLMNSVSENMLDIESSIRAEMKARAFGMDINTSAIRDAAAAFQYGEGTAADLAKAITDQVGSVEEFGNMAPGMQKIYADSVGMTTQELTDMLVKQEALSHETEMYGENGAAALSKVKEMGSSLAGVFSAAIPMLASSTNLLKNVGVDTSKIGGIFGKKGGAAPAPEMPKGDSKGMKGMTDAISKIDAKKLLAGGAALVLVAASVFVFAKAVQEFMNVSWEAVGMAVVSMLALVGALALVGTIMMSGVGAVAILAGAAAMLVIASALFVLGKAIQEIAKGFGMFGELTGQLTGLVMIAPGLLALAGVFAVLGASMIPLAMGLAAITLFLPTLMVLGTMLPLIASSLGFGGGDAGGDAGGVGSGDPLLEEIKGLRSDIQSQPIVIKVNDKLVTEMSRANSRMETVRRQHR